MSLKATASLCLILSLAMSPVSPASEKIAVRANTDFGLDLYARLSQENPGENLFFSPYSISNALAMTAEGARGETALEMGTVLGLPQTARKNLNKDRPWDMSGLHSGISHLNQRFNSDGLPYTLSLANAIWGEKSYPFNPAYLETLNTAYGTDALRLADFTSSAEKERIRINSWVEDQTRERIKDLLPEGSLDAMTRLVLTNAIYFKGDWKTPFDPKFTREGDFSLGEDGKSVKAPLMNARSLTGARYAAFNADGSFFDSPAMIERGKKMPMYPEADGFSIAEIPYQGDQLSMVIIVPNSPDGLPSVEAKLQRDHLDTWISKLNNRKIHITLPKFKSETVYKLNKTLEAMGMPSAFGELSNFDGMKEGEAGANLFISLVVHKAFVEVNEEGTEAAAATAVVASLRMAPARSPFTPEIRADKPFIYLVRDNESGSILFLGRMMKP